MTRSTLAVIGVALLALLLVATPSYADTITVNRATNDWLEAWISAIPNLRVIWLNPLICSRSGIVCDATTQTLSIRLDGVTTSGFNFIGTLPEVSAAINGSNVQVSAISVRGRDRFTGTIPASWSRLTQLRTLDLSRTRLSGSIPDSLGELPNLSRVDFSYSYFCYGMPNWNGSIMTSLTQAVFTNNNLRGTFASSWSTFPSTLTLNLNNNRLCGCMPSTWTTPNLVNAARAMSSATVNRCTRTCSNAELTYCPTPGAKGNGVAGNVATLAAVLVSVTVASLTLLI